MSTIRVVIADDEPLSRERISQLLAEEPDFEVAARCEDGPASVAAIRACAPDLVFLDVRMPGLDGFQVLEALSDSEQPLIVFVTSFDEFAVRAFEVAALDYVLKPVDRDRFRGALERARVRLREGEAPGYSRRVREAVAGLANPRSDPERLVVRSTRGILVLEPGEIDWVEAAGNYLWLHVGAQTHLVRGTLGGFRARPGADRMVQIHRSTLVNLDRIARLEGRGSGDAVVVLRDGGELAVSRRYAKDLRRRLS
jgi:two-component system LytT family response regulator